MHLFHIIEDGAVILKSKGVFRQAKVYRREDRVYSGLGSGFIRLTQGGGTSVPGVSWIDLAAHGVEVAHSGAPKFVGAADQ
jgi:hypothetical protein